MPRPTLAEHRTQVRAHLYALADPNIYTDAAIDQALRTALSILGLYQPITRAVNKNLTAGQTIIDLNADCPAQSVIEVHAPNGQTITQLRSLHTFLILGVAVAATGSAYIYYRATPQILGDGTIEWYDPRYRGPVCLYAAGSLALARALATAETDSYHASQMAYAASLLMRDALALFEK